MVVLFTKDPGGNKWFRSFGVDVLKMDKERQGQDPQEDMPMMEEVIGEANAPVQAQVAVTVGLEEGELATGGQVGGEGGTGATAGMIAAMDALAVIAGEMTPSGSGQAPQPRPQMPMLTPQQVEAVGQRVEPQAVPTIAELAAATGRVEDTVVIAESESPPQAEEQSSDTEPFTAQEL